MRLLTYQFQDTTRLTPEWLVTVQERVNEALHPALPGRWTRVEDPCVPEEFVLHFLARILDETDQVISPHSIKYLSHRGLPYKAQTQKISYRLYDLVALQCALEEQKTIQLCQSAAFRHHEKVQTAENRKKLSMKEKIERMKASANVRYSERTELPTSRSSLVVSVGEGRSTREAEIIYWPSLYDVSKRCKFQLRFFIQKCDYQ
ncbi:Hypothetical predicted protein [Paramuricea clavata]|uniref:Uncharacterized protein n=1 Tax=Paramuricea clavata TaxID=317549 RepID=A0A6S7IS95_PARCT|nr:Hypothetical predicted protein [Paramuricea clavata]